MNACIILVLVTLASIADAKSIYRDDDDDLDAVADEILSLLKKIKIENTHQQRQISTTCDVYHNAKIYTVHENDENDGDWVKNYANVLIVENKMITFVGYVCNDCSFLNYEKAAENYCDGGANYIHLGGMIVLPGIHDVHSHPLEARSSVGGTCLFKSGFTPDTRENIEYLKKCSEDQKGTDWILGHGHSIYDLLDHVDDGGRPPIQILDEAIPDDPVVIMEETSHSVWVNTKALENYYNFLTGNNVIGGMILDGKYKGILLENAGMEIMELAMSPTKYTQLPDLNYKGLLNALKVLRENGITSVCDARSFWRIDHHKVWERAKNEDELTVRAILDLWAYPNLSDEEQIPKLKELYQDDPNSLLRMSQIKVYSDGIIPTTTAAVLDDYKEPLEIGGLGKRGMNYFTQKRLKKYIEKLQSFGSSSEGNKGFDFHIHAIGDRGIRESLNAIEFATDDPNDQRVPRHRITHLEIINTHDIPRFKQLNVIADFQVAGNFTLPDHRKEIADQVGWCKANDSIPVKDVYKTGAVVTLSSDWDVSPVNPFLGIQHVISRGHESVDIKSAVEMYTINPAYVMRQEHKVGSLCIGKEADFIVIDQDIFKMSKMENQKQNIKNTKVLRTVLQGKTVYIDENGYD